MTSKTLRKSACAELQTSFAFNPRRIATAPHQVDFGFLRPLKPTPVFETYWRFAAERQNVFFRRVRNDRPPWTQDQILQEYKFTNAYRASDRVSQYLIRHVIYDGDQSVSEVCFRTLLFKIFNRIETWERLKKNVAQIRYEDYDYRLYDKVLTEAMAQGERVYSAAYIMPSGGPKSDFARKHQMHLKLLERMMADSLPEKLADCKNLSSVFNGLKEYPTIGDFLAFQYTIDLNYTEVINFKESEFVVAGPGAKDGIRKCFSDSGGLNEAEVIRFITERQTQCFEALGIQFASLWGRPLQPIDCQNLFCEVDKYARVAHPEVQGVSGRSRIKQKLRPADTFYSPWYPPKWGINGKIKEIPDNVPRT